MAPSPPSPIRRSQSIRRRAAASVPGQQRAPRPELYAKRSRIYSKRNPISFTSARACRYPHVLASSRIRVSPGAGGLTRSSSLISVSRHSRSATAWTVHGDRAPWSVDLDAWSDAIKIASSKTSDYISSTFRSPFYSTSCRGPADPRCATHSYSSSSRFSPAGSPSDLHLHLISPT